MCGDLNISAKAPVPEAIRSLEQSDRPPSFECMLLSSNSTGLFCFSFASSCCFVSGDWHWVLRSPQTLPLLFQQGEIGS